MEYVQHLEEEIAHLRQMDVAAREEKTRLEVENATIRQTLVSPRVALSPSQTATEEVALFQDPAIASVGFDDYIGQDRIFVVAPGASVQPASDFTSQLSQFHTAAPSTSIAPQVHIDDPFKVLDFILA